MKIDTYTYTDGDKEIRFTMCRGLVCPNPAEYARMTRSYEQMRAEYDLLHCLEVTEEDILNSILRD
jgi:hypothetical protein